MTVKRLTRVLTVALLALIANGCSSTSALNMMDALGGTEGVTKLAGSVLQGAAANPQLGSLLSGKNLSSLTPMVSNQLCSMLGGGCQAPLTNEQITAGAAKLSTEQKSAASSVFTQALDAVKTSPAAQQAITKAVGPNIGGIIAAVL